MRTKQMQSLTQELAAIENESRRKKTRAYLIEACPEGYEMYLHNHSHDGYVMTEDEWQATQSN